MFQSKYKDAQDQLDLNLIAVPVDSFTDYFWVPNISPKLAISPSEMDQSLSVVTRSFFHISQFSFPTETDQGLCCLSNHLPKPPIISNVISSKIYSSVSNYQRFETFLSISSLHLHNFSTYLLLQLWILTLEGHSPPVKLMYLTYLCLISVSYINRQVK